MFGSVVLEVAIGLSLMFALLSLIVTSAREGLEALLQTRAIHLERGIRELLKDEHGTKLTKQIYAHPIVNSLFRGDYDPNTHLKSPFALTKWWKRLWGEEDKWKRVKFRSNLPAYIPSRNFALALLDIAAREKPGAANADSGPISFERLREGISKVPNPNVRRALMIALDDARGDIDQARVNVEKWFDSSMDRVSGWYRKQTQWILLALGFATAVLLNVDTQRVANALYNDESLRAVIVKDAEAMSSAEQAAAKDGGQARPRIGCDNIKEELSPSKCAERRLISLGYPIGWNGYEVRLADDPWSPTSWWDAIKRSDFPWHSLPGWLITAFALALGAPFWFDLLNKLMVIRSTVKPHEKSPEEASEDRQRPVRNGAGPAGAGTGGGAPPPPATGGPAGQGITIAGDDPNFVPHEWSEGDKQEGDL